MTTIKTFAALALCSLCAHAQIPAQQPPADLPTKRVTLPAQTTTLRNLLAQLQKQTSLAFEFRHEVDLDKSVTLDGSIRDTPLWEALRTLMRLTQTTSMLLIAPEARYGFLLTGAFSSHGPFVVMAYEITQAVHFENDTAIPATRILMYAVSDGSCRIITLPKDPTPAKALDDKGNSLLPARRAEESRASVSHYASFTTEPIFIYLEHSAANARPRAIALLEGAFAATVAFSRDIELAPGKSTEHSIPGVHTAITCGTTIPAHAPPMILPDPAPDTLIVTVHAVHDGRLSDPQWSDMRSAIRDSPIRIVDAQGTPWRAVDVSSVSPPDELWAILHFRREPDPSHRIDAPPPSPGPAVKAIVSLVTRIERIQIPYRIENLLLP